MYLTTTFLSDYIDKYKNKFQSSPKIKDIADKYTQEKLAILADSRYTALYGTDTRGYLFLIRREKIDLMNESSSADIVSYRPIVVYGYAADADGKLMINHPDFIISSDGIYRMDWVSILDPMFSR